MEELPRHLLSLFVSFMKSHSESLPEKDKLVRKMLGMRKVQSIIIETMCKLEPIINEQVIHIKTQSNPKQASNSKESRLLILSRDIQHQMENYINLQEGLSNVISIVESINLNVESLPIEPLKDLEDKPELVKLLETLAGKPRQSSMDFEDISSDIWSKHMEVEKMLKVEMEKYYAQLVVIQSKNFERTCFLKNKTAVKINSLENELKNTWNHFRLIFDRVSMTYEDKLARDKEIEVREDKLLESTSKEPHVKDYASAIAKIKTLFTTRKILEKRKIHDDKLMTGLNSKVSILTEKTSELQEMNLKLLENCGSLSWCLEYLLKNSDIVVVVKEKALKLINKQKCSKLENLFKTSEVFEKFNLETLSKKYENIKEGIANICIHIKDENLKIKLNKLINDSKIEEFDKSSLLKNLQVPKPPISLQKRGKSSGKIIHVKKDSSGHLPKPETTSEKLPKPESVLEKMKKTMKTIDKEISENHKIVEQVAAENLKVRDEVHYEIKIHESLSKDDLPKNKAEKSKRSSNSVGSHKLLENISTRSEELMKEHRSTQTFLELSSKFTEITPDTNDQIFQEVPLRRLFNLQVDSLQPLHFFSRKNKLDTSSQTEKEPGFVEYAANPNSLIRGLMSKAKNPHSDRSFKIKRSIDPTVSENLIIRKIGRSKNKEIRRNFREFSENFEESVQELREEKLLEESHLEKKHSHNNTLPTEKITNICNSPTKIINNRLVSLTSNQNTYQSKVEEASEDYRKEFSLHSQAKGLKKMNFQDIQQIWEEVINRRILEGEKDKISVHLRGYLGTDKFESEKAKVITMIDNQLNEKHAKSSKVLKSQAALINWKKIMKKMIEKNSFNFKSLIEDSDSATEILFKVAKNLKFVRHRLGRHKIKVVESKPEQDIVYAPDKWALNASSLSPLETLKKLKRSKVITKPKYLSRFVSKTPFKEKLLTSETNRLPYL